MFESRVRRNFSAVLRHGRTCSKMRGTVLWIGKWEDRATFQGFHSLLGGSPNQKEELENKGELSEVCSHIALKCLYLARIGRPDILWSVNKLARSVAEWTQACDRRLARLISYIHFTSDYRQYCHVGTAAQHGRLGLFQDSVFSGDLEDSKSTSGGVLCIFGSRTIVPISWMCKKANISISQLYRIRDHLAGCWFEFGWFTFAGSMGFGYWSAENISRDTKTNPTQHTVEFLRTHISLRKNHSCTFSKTTKLW